MALFDPNLFGYTNSQASGPLLSAHFTDASGNIMNISNSPNLINFTIYSGNLNNTKPFVPVWVLN